MLTHIPPAEAASTAWQAATLDRLAVLCRDDAMTFRAAGAVRGKHRTELLAMSRRRSAFAVALGEFVHRPGAARRRNGSVADFLRRSLFELRSWVLGGGHQGDSLRTCLNQEARAERGYLRALEDKGWSSEIQTLLRAQLDDVQHGHARMRALRGEL